MIDGISGVFSHKLPAPWIEIYFKSKYWRAAIKYLMAGTRGEKYGIHPASTPFYWRLCSISFLKVRHLIIAISPSRSNVGGAPERPLRGPATEISTLGVIHRHWLRCLLYILYYEDAGFSISVVPTMVTILRVTGGNFSRAGTRVAARASMPWQRYHAAACSAPRAPASATLIEISCNRE